MIYHGPIPPSARLEHDLALLFWMLPWTCAEGFHESVLRDLWACCESHLFAPPEAG